MGCPVMEPVAALEHFHVVDKRSAFDFPQASSNLLLSLNLGEMKLPVLLTGW